ncbi:MAG: phosphatase PAP2 family protein [Synergistaceae bacterium]|nr:phosphatase PAP2 family protein [Synergistaceae bacterium]
MDITYLLWLQDLRNSMQDAWTPFFEWLSTFGTRGILFLPAVLYWCIDKKKGLFVFYSLKISHAINSVVKLTACVYRPWVRDPRIIPAGDSITTATGYSFPSGHTMMVTPIYGALAFCVKNKFVRLILICAILLTGFSRNYLGVHTPQDVLVGLALGFMSVYIAKWVFEYLDKHPEKDTLVMIISALFGILTLVYVSFKSYPMDYVDGKLLVDPVKMTVDAWGDAGGLPVLILAWYIESRFVKFTPTGINAKGVILAIIGLIPLYWIVYKASSPMAHLFGPHLGKLARQILIYFYIIVIWPFVMKLFAAKKSAE